MFWQASKNLRRQSPRGEASLREHDRPVSVSTHAYGIPPERWHD